MTKCPGCGKKIEKRTIREFRDDVLLGLSGVVLVDSVVRYRARPAGSRQLRSRAGASSARRWQSRA